MRRRVLLIYTGGTIGMKSDGNDKVLKPFDFAQIYDEFPYLRKLEIDLEVKAFTPIDSSNVTPDLWVKLAEIIKLRYDDFDGFVILHGTDTMPYTASALSFMLLNLNKAVVLTGSQIPIGVLRTDGRENLITAIEIAAAHNNGESVVPEVTIFFQNRLFRGNRAIKHSAEALNAFSSYNYPVLAEVGVNIHYNTPFIAQSRKGQFDIDTRFNSDVIIVKIFPSLTESMLRAMLSIKGLRGVVLETYGSGNAPTAEWFIDTLKRAIEDNIVIVNITQCREGEVAMGLYQTGVVMDKIGVLGGGGMTSEAAVTKLCCILGRHSEPESIVRAMKVNIAGEI